MNQKMITIILAHLHLYIFTFFLLSENSFCIDPYYEACVPKDCGNGHNISYPFYIHGQQESYCGYPGFELNCTSNGFPLLHIPDNDYVVQQIHYGNQSIRVSNAAAVLNNSENGCFPLIRNVTLERNSVFRMGNYSTNLVFLSDCKQELDLRLRGYGVGCGGGGGGGEGLVMLESDVNLGLGKEECGENVVAPVELDGGGSDGIGNGSWSYYEELLRKGFLMKWTAGDCSICLESGGRCGFNQSNFYFRCFCPDRPHAFRCIAETRNKKVIIVPVAVTVGIVVLVITVCTIFKSTLAKYMALPWKKAEKYQNVENFLKNYGSLAPKRYSYSDVKKMTNSFKSKLGQGGYGQVYKGRLDNGNLVAVKILNGSKGNGEDFINEVASISRTSHVNIVSFLGFCFEGHKRALVYEFMPNGSLEKFIYNKGNSLKDRQLGWEKLYQIAIGIARGLEYLHRGCNTRILHFDIKPQNILLDEDFCPKIADFGLAKLCPGKESVLSTLTARGTIGYIAPEVFCRNFGGVSYKSDVYSYGMMVSEMVGGRKNIEVKPGQTSEIYFPHWIHKRLESGNQLGLHGIMNDGQNEIARKMIIVSLWCIQTDPLSRPSMIRVVEMLEASLESLQIPPKPYLSSPSRSPERSSTIGIL